MRKKIAKIFLILAMIFAVPFGASAFSQITNYSHIKTGVVNYASEWTTYLPANIRNQVLEWEAHHFDIVDSGLDLTMYNPNAIWGIYKDNAFVYPTEIPAIRTFADSNGFNFEDILLHMKTDYQVSSSYAWTNQTNGMDMFDVFEGANGILLQNGSTFVDETTQAYNATTADVPITDKILFGYGEPFAEINFNLSTVAAGGVNIFWEYWNGSGPDGGWNALNLSSDTTNALTQNGKVTFVPPADWIRTTENGSQSKWWVRAVAVGGTTKPIATKIYGDNWMATDGTNNCRGWDETDPNILNKGLGELEYNPTPATASSAKFRYQARVTGIQGWGATFGNPANIQNGKRTFAQYLTSYILKNVQGTNYNSTFFDDAETSPAIISPANEVANESDYTDSHTGTYVQEKIAQTQEEASEINLSLPKLIIGKNTTSSAMAYVGDWSLHENLFQAISTGSESFNVGATVSFDQYLHANNPTDIAGVFMIGDTYPDMNKDTNSNWYFWDRGNRGPLSALTAYYMGANPNTYFAYNSLGWSYYETDDFIYYSSNSTTLTQDLIADSSSATKNIYGNDFSAFPTTGTLELKIGDSSDTEVLSSFTKKSSTWLQTTVPIHFNHSVGEKIQFAVRAHQAADTIPLDGSVTRYANTFPAVYYNIGAPDSNGQNGGSRNLDWIDGSTLSWANGADQFVQQTLDTSTAVNVTTSTLAITGTKWGDSTKVRFVGQNLPAPLSQNTTYWLTNTADGSAKIAATSSDAYSASVGVVGHTINLTSAGLGTFQIYRVGQNIWRRDYTNAIILHRPAQWNSSAAEYNTYSMPIDLGGTYYPLKADGTLASPITSISLRTGEGAILIKASAVSSDKTAPAAPSGLSVQ